MSQQIINLGLIPNDGSGDALRVGAQKINENFTELYERGIPEQAGNNGKVLTTSGTVLRWDRVTDITGNAATVTNGVYTTGSYDNPSWIASLSPSKVLPSQSGNNGKYLTTDGATLAWVDLEAVSIFDYNNLINRPVFPDNTSDLVNDSGFITSSALTGYATETYVNSRGFITSNGLPSQSGNNGKYLTTDGTSLSWATVASGAGDRLVNGVNEVVLGTTGTVTFPNGALKIAGNTISNYVANEMGANGSQLEVTLAKTVITNGVTNTLGGSTSLTSQSLFEVSTNGILSSFQVINTLDDTSLTGEFLTELDNTSFKIGQRITNDLGSGTPLVAFNGWTFRTDAPGYTTLTFPNGALQQDSALVVCLGNASTVVYISSADVQHTIKLLIQVEGLVGAAVLPDTQACEMIIAKSFRANDIASSVYAVVHTSAAPLATFTAEWNAVTSRVEVICTPTGANGVNVKSFATEITAVVT
jgi:hypothetical protein